MPTTSRRKGRIAKRMEKALESRIMERDITRLVNEHNNILARIVFQIFDAWGYSAIKVFAQLCGLPVRRLNRIAYVRQKSCHLREAYIQSLPLPKSDIYTIKYSTAENYNNMHHRIKKLADTYHEEIYNLFWYAGVRYGEYGIRELGNHLGIRPPDPQTMIKMIQLARGDKAWEV